MKDLLARFGRRNLVLAGGTLVVVVASIGVAAWLSQKPPSDSVLANISATARLQQTIQKMQDSFGGNSQNYGRVNQQYLKFLEQIQADCKIIQQTGSSAGDVTKALLRNNKELCKDLGKLATDSAFVYQASAPLLSSGSSLKRYMTIGLIQSHIRQQHMSAVSKALRQLEHQADDSRPYTTSALQSLKTLQRSIDTSEGLKYLPQLRLFQMQLLADRQQYWTGYADIDSLKRTLTSQLEGLCSNLDSSYSEPSECKKRD